MTAPAVADTSAELKRVMSDPVLFSKGILGHDIWDIQAQILQSIATHDKTAVKACHASSKTFTAADAALWWVSNFPDGKVVTTAPTWTQVEKLLWGNIKSAIATSSIKFPEPNKTYLELGVDNYILGLSTDEGVRFQGWHGTILIILDEAPGVLAQIYEAIEGIRAGGKVHVLLLGNPTFAAGPFFNAFTKDRAEWNCFTINAFDTPNFRHLYLEDQLTGYIEGTRAPGKFNILDLTDEELHQLGQVRPYLVQPKWVKAKYGSWGPGKRNPLWQSKVLGEFPDNAEDALIPLSWIERAAPLKSNIPLATRLTAGIDVAGPGEDETSLKIRQAGNLVFEKSWSEADPRGYVLKELAPYRARLSEVNIDSIGIGYYFSHHIQDAGYKVNFVDVSKDPDALQLFSDAGDKDEQFADLKSKLYWRLRQKFDEDLIGGITDPETISQLASLRWGVNKKGQILIKSKKELREEFGIASPDRAEGTMLCYADIAPRRKRKALPGSHSSRSLRGR